MGELADTNNYYTAALRVVGGPNAGQIISIERNLPKVRLLAPKSIPTCPDFNTPPVESIAEITVYRRMRMQADNYQTEILVPDSWSDAMVLVQLIRGYNLDK